MVNHDTLTYNSSLSAADKKIGSRLAEIIDSELADAENKIWHAHPVWFLSGNPIVGYSKLKDGIRLMFWSGASFDEANLKPGTGKFKDASVRYTDADQIVETDVRRWLKMARTIQWDYKNIYKAKGRLVRIS
jgi:hypothetical protein